MRRGQHVFYSISTFAYECVMLFVSDIILDGEKVKEEEGREEAGLIQGAKIDG